jgi:hypothetical protein
MRPAFREPYDGDCTEWSGFASTLAVKRNGLGTPLAFEGQSPLPFCLVFECLQVNVTKCDDHSRTVSGIGAGE